ncbi:MAG: hypothetical protein ACFE8O_01790 [Candidatus Hermodarchaeota archaeon]
MKCGNYRNAFYSTLEGLEHPRKAGYGVCTLPNLVEAGSFEGELIMGFFEKIKDWFRQLISREPQVQEVKGDQALQSEVDQLLNEHTSLSSEYEQIRKELAEIDDKLSMGELDTTKHDREYRARLVRTSQIRLRQMEIRERLADLGSPLPEESV